MEYVYDPAKQILAVYENNKIIGGYIGIIAERALQRLIMTDRPISIGKLLSYEERQDKQHNNEH